MPYLQGLGVAAIWISPPVQNVNVPVRSAGSTGRLPRLLGHGLLRPRAALREVDDVRQHGHGGAHDGIKVIVDWAPTTNADPKTRRTRRTARSTTTERSSRRTTTTRTVFPPQRRHLRLQRSLRVWYKSSSTSPTSRGRSRREPYLHSAVDTWLRTAWTASAWMRSSHANRLGEGVRRPHRPPKSVFSSASGSTARRHTLSGGDQVREHRRPVGAELRPQPGRPRRVREQRQHVRSWTRRCRASLGLHLSERPGELRDTQDKPRFLSVNNNTTRLNEANVVT